MKIYTKKGDDGSTGLFNGERVSKSSDRVSLYGTSDELNSIIGLALVFGEKDALFDDLTTVSHTLFNLGSDLATPLEPELKFEVPRINDSDTYWLESRIDKYDESLPPLKAFILPGGCKRAAFLHQARTVNRRVERMAVQLSQEENIGNFIIKYLNRLSDYLFAASRYANFLEGVSDVKWKK